MVSNENPLLSLRQEKDKKNWRGKVDRWDGSEVRGWEKGR